MESICEICAAGSHPTCHSLHLCMSYVWVTGRRITVRTPTLGCLIAMMSAPSTRVNLHVAQFSICAKLCRQRTMMRQGKRFKICSRAKTTSYRRMSRLKKVVMVTMTAGRAQGGEVRHCTLSLSEDVTPAQACPPIWCTMHRGRID